MNYMRQLELDAIVIPTKCGNNDPINGRTNSTSLAAVY